MPPEHHDLVPIDDHVLDSTATSIQDGHRLVYRAMSSDDAIALQLQKALTGIEIVVTTLPTKIISTSIKNNNTAMGH